MVAAGNVSAAQQEDAAAGHGRDFREPLLRLWKRGCHKGANLLIRIRKLGYIGSLTSLNRFLAPWRAAKRAARAANRLFAGPIGHSTPAASAMRHISPQEAAALLGKPKPMLNERQSRIVEFLKRTPAFATMRHLLLSFRSILCCGRVSSLRRWARQVNAAGIASLSRFVGQLKKDWKAVENAVNQVWSNGPTEGHINRLKMLKRQMYGRAGVELLRARLLPYPTSPMHQK
jgi:transposase